MAFNVAGNRNSSETITWQPDPEMRGTWSILSTCIITNSLCIWTAVHLNVPPPNMKYSQFWRKLLWVGLGLFAPELVAYTAWVQRLAAKKGLRDIRKAMGHAQDISWPRKSLNWVRRSKNPQTLEVEASEEVESPATRPSKEGWTLTHAFFAYMGGFALDSKTSKNSPSPPILPPNRETMRLTLKGVVKVLNSRPDLLENSQLDDILDKSKASSLAKGIVCGQALWFCVQCLGRLIASLPMTLLELNTFAHCVFALFSYMQWWYKPLDIATPITFRGEAARDMLAWLSMHMPMKEMGISDHDTRCEIRRIRVVDRDDPYFRSISTSRIDARSGVWQSKDGETKKPVAVKPCMALLDCDELLDTGLCFYDEGQAANVSNSWFVFLRPMDVERWKCAAALFKENSYSGLMKPERLLNSYTSDFPFSSLGAVGKQVSAWISLAFTGLLYGGLHALTWNSKFPNRMQTRLWQASILFVFGLGPLLMIGLLFCIIAYRVNSLFTHLRKKLGQRPDDKAPTLAPGHRPKSSPILRILRKIFGLERDSLLVWFVKIGLYLIYAAVLLCLSILLISICIGYITARVFIIVECFITLFHSEPAMFETLNWLRYFPHIS